MTLQMLFVVFWLLPALAASSHEMVRVRSSPSVSAACDQPVALNCSVDSSSDRLSIKHMEWSLNQRSLCSVDAHEHVTTHSGNTTGRFHCTYAQGRLVLILHKVRPKDAVDSDYMCKLKSNRGAKHTTTRLQLQECCGGVHIEVTSEASTCIFQHVHQGGDVHWFHGQHNKARLHEDIDTSSFMDGDGWWTISSSLLRSPSHKAFNCSLVGTSGRYLRSALVQPPPPPSTAAWTTNTGGSLLTPIWSLLCVSIYTLL